MIEICGKLGKSNLIQATLNPSLLFPICSLKSISTFTTKISLIKPDTFDFKPSLLPPTPIPSSPSYHSPQLLLNRKTQKTVCV